MGVAPPPSNMPSLNALRAFEVAARLGSFTLAASELRISAAGVAHHVKGVEAWAEQSLFHRMPHGVRLTAAGEASLPLLSDAFSTLGRATVELRARRSRPTTLRIAALPAVAQVWLAPRLAELSAALPAVSISVDAVETPPDLRLEPYDMTIFYSSRSEGRPVDELFPVAAPHIAAHLQSITDLGSQRLLQDTVWLDDWQSWLDASAVDVEMATSGTSYTLYAMALDAAIRGEGVLMGRASLVTPLIESGRLVEPFELRVPTQDSLEIRFREPIDPALQPLESWAEQALAHPPATD